MGWSLKRLGEMLGISYQQVQKYEKGSNRIPVDMLIVVAREFGCSLDELCGIRQPSIDFETAKIMKRIEALRSPVLRAKLMGLLEMLDPERKEVDAY